MENKRVEGEEGREKNRQVHIFVLAIDRRATGSRDIYGPMHITALYPVDAALAEGEDATCGTIGKKKINKKKTQGLILPESKPLRSAITNN